MMMVKVMVYFNLPLFQVGGKMLSKCGLRQTSKTKYYANTRLKVTMSKVFISFIKSVFKSKNFK